MALFTGFLVGENAGVLLMKRSFGAETNITTSLKTVWKICKGSKDHLHVNCKHRYFSGLSWVLQGKTFDTFQTFYIPGAVYYEENLTPR